MTELRPLKFEPGCNTAPDVIRDQFKTNIKRYLPYLVESGEIKEKPIAIVCGGPSLERRWEELKDFPGEILACNGAYKFLINRDIVPSYFMLLDCRRENIGFLDYTASSTTYFIAAQCHPLIFDELSRNNKSTYMYFTNLPDIKELLGDRLKTEKFTVLGGVVGTVGIKAMSMAHALGYRDMHLYGYDSSYEDDSHHAYEQAMNDAVTKIEVFIDHKKYITSASFAHQAQEFPGWAGDLTKFHGCNIELHCDGLLPDLVDYCNRIGEGKSLEDREREKYQEIWSHKNYRKFSPGERLVDYAFESMGMKQGESLIDFGCGTGRAANKFKLVHGMVVCGVDHAGNCLDDDINITFENHCLWEMHYIDHDYDWGYCCDVMEHIPTEKVHEVMKRIASISKKGAFLNIATRDDDMGNLIGKKLHMTVADASAWETILKRHFKTVKMTEKQGEADFCCWH